MKLRANALIAAGLTALFSLCVLRNRWGYKDKPWGWIGFKSLVDALLIALAAWKMPAVLVAWCTVWFTRPCKTPLIKTTAGLLSGVFFEMFITVGRFIPGVAFLEVLCVVAVFAIDLATGTNGFLRNKNYYERKLSNGPEHAAA